MSRMFLSLEGVVIKEIVLDKEHTTLGRRPYSDVVIDNLAVSGEHAAVRLTDGEAVLEDLQSTNGTYVNGVAIKRHVLQDGDRIDIGKYRLTFEKAVDPVVAPPLHMIVDLDGEEPQSEPGANEDVPDRPEAELPEEPAAGFADTTLPAADATPARPALITVLSGSAAGREVELVKVVTTIGKSGIGIASITKRPKGFSLAHVEGNAHPTVNGSLVGGTPVMLHHGDLVELAGIRMQFAQSAG